MLQIILAIVAGLLTIGAPCILPLLPILLASSVGRQNIFRPLFIISGFIISFAATALFLSYIINRFMIAPNSLRTVAAMALALFGFFMIFPKLFEKITKYLNPLINKAENTSRSAGQGNWGGFILGLLIGIIWTPCAGPVLGAILTLIATSNNVGFAAVLLISYSIGASIPMLLIAYGSQYITTKISFIARYSRIIQQSFGVIVILFAVALFFQFDIVIQTKLLQYFPSLTPVL